MEEEITLNIDAKIDEAKNKIAIINTAVEKLTKTFRKLIEVSKELNRIMDENKNINITITVNGEDIS